MGFKKTKIGNKNKVFSNVIGVIAIAFVFLFGIALIKNIEIVKIDIPETNDTKESDTEEISEKKEDKEKINFLIVGRGGDNHDAPNLTDTIILASINSKQKNISLLSIPRDLFVEYPNGESGKINEIYITFAKKLGSNDRGMNSLKNKVSQITGEKIDYFVNIDFNGFKKVIDTIGGVDVTLDKQFVDYSFPDGNGGYRTFVLRKGTWTLDGEIALNYARSRHSTSDFDRSLRQQQIIAGVKDKLSSGNLLTSPKKLTKLYEIFKQYIHTDVNFSDIVKLSYLIKSAGDYEVISSNLNDSCFYGSDTCSKGGLLYIPEREYFGGRSVLLSYGTNINNLNNYSSIHTYTDLVFNYSQFFKENLKLNIYNSTRVNLLASTMSNDIKKYGFNLPLYNSIGNTNKLYEKSTIYYNGEIKDSVTLEVMKKFFSGEYIETDIPMYSNDPEVKIEVIIGEDYQDKFNF